MDDEITTGALEAPPDDGVDVAAEAPESVVDAPPTPDEGDGEPEAPPRLYAGKYKTPDELESAYEEAQRWGHEQAQQRAAYERQYQEWQQTQQQQASGQPNPWAALPGGVPDWQIQQAVEAAQENPKGAALWAYEYRDQLPNQLVSALFVNWQQNDYFGAQEWRDEQFWTERSKQFEQQLHEQYQPFVENSRDTINSATITLAEKQIPNWGAWAPHIVAYLEQNPAAAQHLHSLSLQPQQAAEYLDDIYAIVSRRARRSGTPVVNQQAAAAQPEPAGTPSGATTVTGNTGDAPELAGEEDEFTQSLKRGLQVLGRGRKTT